LIVEAFLIEIQNLPLKNMRDLLEIYDLIVHFVEKDENTIIEMADNLLIEGLLDKRTTRQSLFEEVQKIDLNLRDINFLRICEIYDWVVPYF
jgi:hypothetical protein